MSKQFSMSRVSMSKKILFQTIQFSMQKQFHFKQFSLASVHSLNIKTVLLQAIQFNISTQFSSIWPIDRIISGVTSLGQREPESDGYEGVLHIPQSSSNTGTSPSDCLVSYPEHSLGVFFLCRGAVGIFYSPNQVGNLMWRFCGLH